MSGKSTALSVSVVTFNPDLDVLEKTLESLITTLAYAKKKGALHDFRLYLVDNGPGHDWPERLSALVKKLGIETVIITGHGNVGYGIGHNLAISRDEAEFHLVLNPDVFMDIDAIEKSIRFMKNNPHVAMLTPSARNLNGEREYLAKGYPSVSVLFLRSMSLDFLLRRFKGSIDEYEIRHLIGDEALLDVPLAGGAFMFLRRECIRRINGFSRDYFMYFEDFDLCMRLRREAKIAYVPSVKIVHLGGNASKKGLKHIYLFVRSAITFFSKYGWRF